MEFFDTIRQVQANWEPYKKWEVEQQKKEKQNEELRKKYPPTPQELEHAKQYGRTIVDVINTMDQHSIDKSEDASLIVRTYGQIINIFALGLFMPLNNLVKNIPAIKNNKNLKQFSWLITMFVEGSIASSAVEILQAKYEKQASRIARYQTRENDLKDYRHFVIYNEQQINEAEKIAKTLPYVKSSIKSQQNGFNPIENYKNAQKTTKSLKEDNINYENWKKDYSQEEILKLERFKTLNPPQKDMDKAEKDRDALLNTIKVIEKSSLNYLNNMSLAITCTVSSLMLGSYFGVAGINMLLCKFQDKITFLNKNHKLLPKIMTIDIIVIPIILPFLLLSQIIKLQKDSARVGRFKAKQDLLSHPEKFINYTDNQRKNIPTPNNPSIQQNGFFSEIIQDFNELKNYKKDYGEYNNYIETTQKKELKVDEALKQVKISETQKADAIHLQKNAFHSFEKLDEKAQRFTDDTAAAVDIINQLTVSLVKTILDIIGFVKTEEMATKVKITNKDILKSTLPFLMATIVSPLVNIWGTRIKKDAGKIGVMTAMKDLDDPKNFLNEKPQQSR